MRQQQRAKGKLRILRRSNGRFAVKDDHPSTNMEITKQYDTQGYVVIKKLFCQDEIGNITAMVVDRIYQQWLAENREALSQQQLVNMHSLTSPKYFLNHSAARIKFFEFLVSRKLTDLLEHLFGDGLYFHNTQLFFNPIDQSQLPYWHRDLQYSPIEDEIQAQAQPNLLSLHVRIPLVIEKGIELIPGTHKRWDTELERNVRLELNNHTNSEELPGAVLIGLEPGDILIFNAQMIHRGNYQLNPARKALDLCLGKEHPLTAKFLTQDILPSEREIRYIRNKQWYKRAREIVTGESQ